MRCQVSVYWEIHDQMGMRPKTKEAACRLGCQDLGGVNLNFFLERILMTERGGRPPSDWKFTNYNAFGVRCILRGSQSSHQSLLIQKSGFPASDAAESQSLHKYFTSMATDQTLPPPSAESLVTSHTPLKFFASPEGRGSLFEFCIQYFKQNFSFKYGQFPQFFLLTSRACYIK